MDKSHIEKIKQFYNPGLELFGDVFSLSINGNKKTFAATSTKDLLLGFGESAKTEEEAIQKGFLKTNPLEIFKNIFPERWDEIKHKYSDERTEKHLQKCKEEIGLIKIEHGHDEAEFQSYGTLRGYFNSSDIEIGLNDNNEWIVQFSKKIDIDDYDITKMFFKDKPNWSKIKTANLIEEIELYFAFGRYERVYFTCLECGRRVHWLDIKGNLQDKWINYREEYCGC